MNCDQTSPLEPRYRSRRHAASRRTLVWSSSMRAFIPSNTCKLACHNLSEMAEGCGTAYYRYGAALFYRAQEDQDVFGDDMKTAAQQRDVQVVDCALPVSRLASVRSAHGSSNRSHVLG